MRKRLPTTLLSPGSLPPYVLFPGDPAPKVHPVPRKIDEQAARMVLRTLFR